MPKTSAVLLAYIPLELDVASVAAAAAELLAKIKDAAQKRDVHQLNELLYPELAKDKSKVYDLFDPANYRAHTLGRYASESNGEVSVQFFELTPSQVERVHYAYFSAYHGKIVLRDVKSGPEEAERFLRDEEALAQGKIQLMFHALNDGDDAALKALCSAGLYQSIKAWGGDKHPGDRLLRGRTLDQVSVKTLVPLDQKSVRIVADISYTVATNKKLEFEADFERFGNDLKIVSLRDSDNKFIAFDPDMDNYLNRRYNLPDVPLLNGAEMAMTERAAFFPLSQLRQASIRALEDHNPQKINEIAQALIDSDPGGGEGFGLRAGADQLLGNYEDAEKDADRALANGGTVYLLAQRHGVSETQPFTPVILGISASKIFYWPARGQGQPAEIGLSSLERVTLDSGRLMIGRTRPFLSVSFTANDGKKLTYNFAAVGTACPGPGQPGPNLIQVPAGQICGVQSPDSGGTVIGIMDDARPGIPLLVPRDWQKDLTLILRTIQDARNKSQK
jgi:hypothetical protein